jgi:hypothetical protein
MAGADDSASERDRRSRTEGINHELEVGLGVGERVLEGERDFLGDRDRVKERDLEGVREREIVLDR